jgi:hypothetical protein
MYLAKLFKRKASPQDLAQAIADWGDIVYKGDVDFLAVVVPRDRKTAGIMVSNKQTHEIDELLNFIIARIRKNIEEYEARCENDHH